MLGLGSLPHLECILGFEVLFGHSDESAKDLEIWPCSPAWLHFGGCKVLVWERFCMFFIAQVRLRLALDHQSSCLRLPSASAVQKGCRGCLF